MRSLLMFGDLNRYSEVDKIEKEPPQSRVLWRELGASVFNCPVS